MKKVNTWILFVSSFCVGILMAVCVRIIWKEYETLPYSKVQKIFLQILNILQFQIHPNLEKLFLKTGGLFIIVFALTIDCLFYGFFIERFFSLFRKKSKIPLGQTRI